MKTQGQFLQSLYQNFQKNKKNLSRRAFAKFLGVDPSRLHDFMGDKRVMTLKTAEQVCARLQLDTHISQEFHNIVSSQRSKRRSKSQPIQVSTEDFQKLSGWHFFAVLALIDKLDMSPQPPMLSEKLGIPKDQVDEALKTLIGVGFICENDGHYSVKTSTRDLRGRNDFYEINIQIIPEK